MVDEVRKSVVVEVEGCIVGVVEEGKGMLDRDV